MEKRTSMLDIVDHHGQRQTTRGSEGDDRAKDQHAWSERTITAEDTLRTLAVHQSQRPKQARARRQEDLKPWQWQARRRRGKAVKKGTNMEYKKIGRKQGG